MVFHCLDANDVRVDDGVRPSLSTGVVRWAVAAACEVMTVHEIIANILRLLCETLCHL